MSDVKKIIIADASEEYRGMLADALGDREDMEVVAQTGDGEALLDLVAKHQPQGIIMDLMLTGMDGLEVLEQLGPNRPRVVVLSAFVTLCEWYLGILPTLELWGELFYLKLSTAVKGKAAQCGASMAVPCTGSRIRFPSIALLE